MLNVVDSSGWIEYFTGGRNAGFFAPAIRDLAILIVPTLCMCEVFKRLLATLGEGSALQAVGVMALGNEVELSRAIALEAAQVSLRLKLAMADSMILATVLVHGAKLWTQDEHFMGVEGVSYIVKHPA